VFHFPLYLKDTQCVVLVFCFLTMTPPKLSPPPLSAFSFFFSFPVPRVPFPPCPLALFSHFFALLGLCALDFALCGLFNLYSPLRKAFPTFFVNSPASICTLLSGTCHVLRSRPETGFDALSLQLGNTVLPPCYPFFPFSTWLLFLMVVKRLHESTYVF